MNMSEAKAKFEVLRGEVEKLKTLAATMPELALHIDQFERLAHDLKQKSQNLKAAHELLQSIQRHCDELKGAFG